MNVWTQHAPKSSFLIQQGLVNIADEFLVIIMDHSSTCTCRSTYAENRHVILSLESGTRNAFPRPEKNHLCCNGEYVLTFSRHLFMPVDLHTFLSLTRALCRSLVFEGSVVSSWLLFVVKLLYWCLFVVVVFFGNPTDQLRPNYES